MSNHDTASILDPAQLQAARSQLPRLEFPYRSEQVFRRDYDQVSLQMILRILPWVTGLYLLIGAVMLLALSGQDLAIWRDQALLPVGGVLLFLWITLPTRRFDAHINTILLLAMATALLTGVRCVFVLEGTPLARYASYTVFYLVLITFALSRLRLRLALAATALALAGILLSVVIETLQPDWLAFSQYFLLSSGICAVFGYMQEYRERNDWINRQLREREIEELATLRTRADRETRRQQQLNDYLQRIGGNPTPAEIAGRTLGFLITSCNAQIGAMYLATDGRLRRVASNGLEGEAQRVENLGRGETLIGQAAENRRRLRLFHLPADYCTIRTATGSATPAELLIEPVHRAGETLAVIELGALQRFDDETVELLDALAPAMASALVAAIARDSMRDAGFEALADTDDTHAGYRL